MNIVFRADSGCEIGSGHIMRCLTLAVALKAKGHSILFLCKNHSGNILHYVDNSGFKYCCLATSQHDAQVAKHSHKNWVGGSQIDDAKQSMGHIRREFSEMIDWIVVDHYGLDWEWEKHISEITCNIMVIDDLADRKHYCDLLLDQTFGREESDYFHYVEPSCELLTGSDFTLLRDEFGVSQDDILEVRERAANRPNKNILVMMGGADPLNLTLRVLKALVKVPNIKITAVLGSQAPYLKSVFEFVAKHKQVEVLVDSSGIAELMLAHDICIGAAGTSSWERAAMGLPTAMVAFAENQKEVLGGLVDFGAVHCLDMDSLEGNLLDSVKKFSQQDIYMGAVKKSMAVCSGGGVEKVVCAMEDVLRKDVELRLVEEVDCKVLYEWQQTPGTRKYFRSSAVPSWEEHKKWFSSKLKQKDCSIYIITKDDRPVGSIRLEYTISLNSEEVSIQIDPSKLGRGYAFNGMKKLLKEIGQDKKLYAYVEKENKPSHALFQKLGFIKLNEYEYIYVSSEVGKI